MAATAKEVRKWKKSLKELSRKELVEYALRTRIALEVACISEAPLPGPCEIEAQEILDNLDFKSQNWEIGS